ncbi:E3 SUMO-protein ligase KIAA1586-like [Patiria miniata]|uniref:DUF4371 domain-containing protein n=1 Tax=Patiria miniata TaxID=46514 RepID=A0A914ANW7_PATMI|nr:E3 SUMO-protein ligase KIAA1586-like [Patiria miniata]
MKKDAAFKHLHSEMHQKAAGFKSAPASIDDFFKQTTIGKSIRKGEEAEQMRIEKLIDIAYVVCKTEKPFTLFPYICKLEIRHGVELGTSYHTEKKCAEFASCVAEVLKEDLMNDLKDTPKYLTIFIDGSTDVSTTERELMYILYIHEGVPTVKFLKLEHLASANASSIVAAIKSVMGHFNLSNHSLVAFVSDGASVNFGRNSGVVTRLRQEYPDLLGIHCMNHCLELAAKDAFKGTSMEEVITMLNSLYALYSRSPKRMGKLEELAKIMKEDLLKPVKANGTRWVHFKSRAVAALIKSYAVIIASLENEVASTEPAAEMAKLKGYLNKRKSVRFVFHLLLLKSLITPLANLSLALQKDITHFNVALTYLTTFYQRINDLLSALRALREPEDHEDVISTDVDEDGRSLNESDDEPAAKRPALTKDYMVADFQKILHDLMETDSGVSSKDVQLKGQALSASDVDTISTPLITNVKKSVHIRLGKCHEEAQYASLKILDTRAWPTDRMQNW